MSVKSKFCHSLMYTNCYIATQFTQFSTTSNSHKMPCTRHFITFSVFGVSISLKCSFVQAQSQFRLLTLTSYYYYKLSFSALSKSFASSKNRLLTSASGLPSMTVLPSSSQAIISSLLGISPTIGTWICSENA